MVISCGAEVIARHPRSYEQDDFIFDPIHYLPLLERKTGALDQAAPLAGWELPEEYATLRRRAGSQGWDSVASGNSCGCSGSWRISPTRRSITPCRTPCGLGAVGFDAVKHLLLCRIEGRPNRLDLDFYPHLPQVSVQTTRAGDYLTLLSGRAA